MGFEHKIIASSRKVLDKLTCDRCKKEIPKITEGGWNFFGQPFTEFRDPSFENYFHLLHSWGYFSNKDGESHELILCEKCYDIVFAGLDIKITRYF